jgi:hypothetical protein
MNFGISFTPLVPAYVVWATAVVAFAISLLLVFGRTRGALIRTIALALFVLALANPSITREDREPLTSVAVVVVDKSPSQDFGDRLAQTEAVRAQPPAMPVVRYLSSLRKPFPCISMLHSDAVRSKWATSRVRTFRSNTAG